MDYRERIANDEENLRMAFDSILSQVWTAIPAIVESVDYAKFTLTAQPSITGSIFLESGEYQTVNLPLLLDVPFVFPTANGYSLTLPITQGDEVLIVFASRCIDSWWQNGGVQNPVEQRMHDLSDGFAIIGTRSQTKLFANYSSTNAQLRNDNGDVFVEIDKTGKIKLKAPTSVTIDAPETYITGNTHITGNLSVGGNTAITGNTTNGGTISSTGAISSNGDVSGSGTSLHTHTHGGVQSGANNTGVPN